jgi:hypothetical protein
VELILLDAYSLILLLEFGGDVEVEEFIGVASMLLLDLELLLVEDLADAADQILQ